jgi:hypothetical protein
MSKGKQVSSFSSAVATDSLRLDSLQSNNDSGDYHLKTFEAWSPSALLILSALNLLDLYRAA